MPNLKNIPKRYSSRTVEGHDVISMIKILNLNFNEGNILKYLLRNKGEDISDLEKIIAYAEREKEHLIKTNSSERLLKVNIL